jgi:hypothetical protein
MKANTRTNRNRGVTADPVKRGRSLGRISMLVLCVILAAAAAGCQHAPGQAGEQIAAPAPPPLLMEPRAIDLLKASSARLAAARTMSFTAVVSYEHPSIYGPPLVHTTQSAVTLQRPDRLRVITSADGPATEFYYNGKTMVAFSPAENLVAVADAPPTIDAMLEAAYRSAAIYYPFADVMVADPWRDIADGLDLAFYIGRSSVVGGTTTDMVAYATYDVFVQVWIGTEDKLPRRARAIYRSDPAQLRHQMDLSNWQIDPPVAADAFLSKRAEAAKRIPFSNPDAKPTQDGQTPKAR